LQHNSSNHLVNNPETQSAKPRNNTLQALTSAALVLPGLLITPSGHAAGTDRINFQYGRYQEGERNLYGAPQSYKPISADVLHGSGIFSLTDRVKFTFGYTQDTWSGATPVTITPLATTGGNRPYTVNGVVVGASPIIKSEVYLDRDLNPIGIDPITKQLTGAVDTRSVLVMSSASPETRRQANFGLSYEWNEAAVNVSGGFSSERDYQSSFGSMGGRLDFNQKLTSVKFGGGYTSSQIGAILDHDSSPYITKTAYAQQIVNRRGSEILKGDRQDWVANVGLTQVLSKNALVDVGVGYTHSSGFLENPYKATTVIFIDPADLNKSVIPGDVRALIEQRPNNRNQVALNAKYVQYINSFNAAMHLGYRLSVDDWGVNSHTFDASWVQPLGGGWTLTPRIRYYSQDAANFFRPYLVTQQTYTKPEVDSLGRQIWVDGNNPTVQYFGKDPFSLVDQNGNPVDGLSVNPQQKFTSFDAGKLPANFSSDHRLAGFGSLSGGVVLSKILGKGVALEAGFEYYTRASAMQIGGGGNSSYADFDYYVANAAIKFDIEPDTSLPIGSTSSSSESHLHTSAHRHHKVPPATIMFGHMLDKAGDFMAGYRFMYHWTGGNMMQGTHKVSDQTIVNQGCSDPGCQFTPTFMNMRMHMIDLMYAPTKWLNVMLMPTFMDMDMNLRQLAGAPVDPSGGHQHGAAGHETGAVSDTYFSSLVKLLDIPGHRVHVNLGFSAPTGKTDIKLRHTNKEDGGLIHFGMQLGSGTWDFTPSLTYLGEYNRWSWGAQFSGVKRMEAQNKSGYRLGDIIQVTGWSGFDLTHWLTATMRGVYTWQDAIHRDFNQFNARIGPMDFPRNYGGQFWDMGFGVNARIPGGRFVGNQFGFEWVQPIRSDFNGIQLDRQGMLSATWSYQF